jgi:hypothetical protein
MEQDKYFRLIEVKGAAAVVKQSQQLIKVRLLRRASILIFKMRMAARKDVRRADDFVTFAILQSRK